MKEARLKNGRSGQSLMEFALALPLLALLLFGIIQYGFIFSAYMSLRHGAHVTARTLSMAGSTFTSSNATVIARSAIAPMLDASNLVSPVTVSSPNVGGTTNTVRVAMTYNLPLVVPFVVPGSSGGVLRLNAEATYRRN
jgi:Flp pilus assembly protein TadG